MKRWFETVAQLWRERALRPPLCGNCDQILADHRVEAGFCEQERCLDAEHWLTTY